MLDCPDKAGADVPVASLGVGRRLLEPLYAAHIHGLQCFLGVSCAPAHAAHMPLRVLLGLEATCRARGPEMCVAYAERCAGLHDDTLFGLLKCVVREHEHCRARLEACLDCQCHTCAVWAFFGARARRNSLVFA